MKPARDSNPESPDELLFHLLRQVLLNYKYTKVQVKRIIFLECWTNFSIPTADADDKRQPRPHPLMLQNDCQQVPGTCWHQQVLLYFMKTVSNYRYQQVPAGRYEKHASVPGRGWYCTYLYEVRALSLVRVPATSS